MPHAAAAEPPEPVPKIVRCTEARSASREGGTCAATLAESREACRWRGAAYLWRATKCDKTATRLGVELHAGRRYGRTTRDGAGRR